MIKPRGVSPVIGIILLTAVTVALVSLAAFFVFDVGSSSSNSVGTPTVTAQYESESIIDVSMVTKGNADKVIVRSSLGTEYTLSGVGESVTLLNQDGNQTPIVIAEKDGNRNVVREIPPRSFSADIVVSKEDNGQYNSISSALGNASDGDVIVLQRGVYYENIDISTPNITLVGETGTVIADSNSESAVVTVQSSGVLISNIDVNASSSEGGSVAEYSIDTTDNVTLVRSTARNGGLSNTNGDVRFVSSSNLVGFESTDSETVSSRNGVVAHGGNGKTLYVEDVVNGTVVQTVQLSGLIREVEFNPSYTKLAVATHNNNVAIYDVSSWKQVANLTESSDKVSSVSWSPSGDKIAYAGQEEIVYIHDTSDYKLLTTLSQPTNVITRVAWSPSGDKIAYSSSDYNVYVHDSEGYGLNTTLQQADNFVVSLNWKPDGSRIAYGDYNGNVYIHRTDNFSLSNNLSQANDAVYGVAWSPEGKYIGYTGGGDNNAYVHETDSYNLIKTLTASTSTTRPISWSPEGDKVSYGSADTNVYIHNVSDFSLDATLEDQSDTVFSVQWEDENA